MIGEDPIERGDHAFNAAIGDREGDGMGKPFDLNAVEGFDGLLAVGEALVEFIELRPGGGLCELADFLGGELIVVQGLLVLVKLLIDLEAIEAKLLTALFNVGLRFHGCKRDD
jgi:hypothetical protein